MKVIKPPQKITVLDLGGVDTIFLAGSIEMGKAVNWQDKVIELLSDTDCIIFNPRRDDWDSSWVQSIDNPQFKEQVMWELKALEYADKILMYIDPNTKSPITLLELGLFARDGTLVVCCPDGFYRKGNVDIVCKFYGIEQVDSLEELVKHGLS